MQISMFDLDKPKLNPKLKVLSLFDGISCGRIALERAGFEVDEYIAYEIDKEAIKISSNNYPDIKQCGDVFKADYSKYKDFDLLIGGSPCTYWSVARNNLAHYKRELVNSGLGWELFSQYLRALEEAKPKYFLYENNHSISKKIKEEITKNLGVKPIMINSSLVSAQNRKRLYWTNIPNIQQPDDKHILFRDILERERVDWRELGAWTKGNYFGKTKYEVLKTINDEKSHTCTTCKGHPQNYICNADKTLYSNLTISEYETLQTLPVGYTKGVLERARYKAVGNGWTVDVVAHIFSYLKKI